jgi:flavin reductase (DIM6/NTAB) family NADH-FMN oxidoreductase RutF
MVSDSSNEVRSEALHLLSTGLYVLTSCADDQIHAAAITWVNQVSIQPSLVLVALRRNSRLADSVRNAHRFAVNILEANQAEVAGRFLSHLTARAAESAVAGHGFRMSPAHCPLLTEALAWVECRFAAELPNPGDHALVLGEVTGTGVRRAGAPLVLRDTPWSYGGVPTT